jgi:glucan endo-1,3-beta-D-glucosidase
MRTSTFLSVAAALTSSVSATVYQGFNYGSTFTDNTAKTQADFEAEFTAAKNLVGTSGAFTSARLYTMIQGNTVSDPIQAIPAAIKQKTSLLLGIWASGGQAGVTNEIAALTAAITNYGTDFTDLVVGLSVGSEDLYRVSVTGLINDPTGVGADPTTLVEYITQVKTAIKGTALANVPIGHVDTWNSWTNSSNNAVIDAIDWLGVDEYPYFQNTVSNSIDSAYDLFWEAYNATAAAGGGKPVWITETGWPISGKTENLGVPSLANAKTFWDEIGCASAFGKVNTWWYVLQDAAPTTPVPSFGLLGSTTSDATLGTQQPLYDLSCANVSLPASLLSSPSTATTSGATATKTGSTSGTQTTPGSAGSTGTGTGSGSGTSGTSSSTSASPSTKANGASTVAASSMFLAYALFAGAALF